MQAKSWHIFGGLALGIASLLYMQSTKTLESTEKNPNRENLPECSKEKLLNILEELRIEYTPYYTHFYHMLTALAAEYEDKPILQQKLRDKIKDKLEVKVEQIQEDIIEKYLIKDSD